MKIVGLARTTLELAKYYEKAGHSVTIKEPSDASIIYGEDKKADVYTIHSQLDIGAYFDEAPKFLVCHGEPLSSVSNGVSFKAVTDLASKMDAFICFRKDEQAIWNTLKRTYYVPKGIDLEFFHPITEPFEKLAR